MGDVADLSRLPPPAAYVAHSWICVSACMFGLREVVLDVYSALDLLKQALACKCAAACMAWRQGTVPLGAAAAAHAVLTSMRSIWPV